jgi:hypothetical protein
MSEQTAEGEARAAEIRRDVEAADARRADEEVATAEEQVTDATKTEEKLSRRARRKREKAARAAQAAQAAREQADAVAARERERAAARVSSVSGAAVASPGVGADPRAAAAAADRQASPPAGDESPPLGERPEVLIGAAFVGAFLFARVLKRIVD